MTMLPTDNENCDSLYDRYGDPVWVAIWEKTMPHAVETYFAKEGVTPPDGLAAEYASSRSSFRGRYVEAIRAFAHSLFIFSERDTQM